MRTAAAGRITKWLATLTVLAVSVVLVSGCAGGSLSSVFSGEDTATAKMAPVKFAPIIGPPANVGNQLTEQLVTAAKQKKIPVVAKGRPATYTVQGYLAQSNDRRTEKFSYILDVTDTSGNRVHRIIGEEAVPAKAGAKPWASINKAALQKIATKTTTDLATWLPKQSGSTAAVASRTPSQAQSAQRKPEAQRKPPTATASSAQRRTASTSRRSEPVAALVPPVSGAPGDGRTSLTNALRERLRAKGVQIASTGGTNVYKINGKVSVSAASDGKERIRIDWTLLGPTGQDLGSVTQQSDVEKGSLNRSWGPAAKAAGNAAAAELLKLIEKSRG